MVAGAVHGGGGFFSHNGEADGSDTDAGASCTELAWQVSRGVSCLDREDGTRLGTLEERRNLSRRVSSRREHTVDIVRIISLYQAPNTSPEAHARSSTAA